MVPAFAWPQLAVAPFGCSDLEHRGPRVHHLPLPRLFKNQSSFDKQQAVAMQGGDFGEEHKECRIVQKDRRRQRQGPPR